MTAPRATAVHLGKYKHMEPNVFRYVLGKYSRIRTFDHYKRRCFEFLSQPLRQVLALGEPSDKHDCGDSAFTDVSSNISYLASDEFYDWLYDYIENFFGF